MHRFVPPVLAAGFLTLLSASVPAQEMGEMGAPEEMKEIAFLAGDWDVAFQFRLDPTAEWTTSQCSATFTNILDGAAQEMTFTGSMMGMEMDGRYLQCYDRETHKWQSVWIDNLSARMSYSEGEMKDGAMVLVGTDTMNGMDVMVRTTVSNITPDRFDWKMEQSTDGGKNYFTSATAVYTRAGKKSDTSDEGGW